MESGHLTPPNGEADGGKEESAATSVADDQLKRLGELKRLPPTKAPPPIPIWFRLYLGRLHPNDAKLMLEWLESPLALSAMEGALRNAAHPRTPNLGAPKLDPSSPPQRVTCGECRFWESAPGNVDGECRRRSPLPALASVPDYVACWPETYKDDWCGEGEPQQSQQSQQPQEPKP